MTANRKIKVHAPHALKEWVDFIQDFFAAEIDRGVEFKPSQTVQIGWMVFLLEEDGPELQLMSPMPGVMPCEYVKDCSTGLNVLMWQKYMTESFGSSMLECNFCQSAIVLKGIERDLGIFMNRADLPDGSGSGWFVGAQTTNLDANDPNNLERKSLWEISCRFPETINFWLFDKDCQINLEDPPVILQDYKEVKALPGSFYNATYNQAKF